MTKKSERLYTDLVRADCALRIVKLLAKSHRDHTPTMWWHQREAENQLQCLVKLLEKKTRRVRAEEFERQAKPGQTRKRQRK